MRNLLLLFLIVLSINANCQNNNLLSIPAYNCDNASASNKKFMNSKEIIIVIPNDKDSSTYFKWFTSKVLINLNRMGKKGILLHENELSEVNFNESC